MALLLSQLEVRQIRMTSVKGRDNVTRKEKGAEAPGNFFFIAIDCWTLLSAPIDLFVLTGFTTAMLRFSEPVFYFPCGCMSLMHRGLPETSTCTRNSQELRSKAKCTSEQPRQTSLQQQDAPQKQNNHGSSLGRILVNTLV